MAKRDDRTFIFVHDGMPEHWKVEDLSDSAFRLMVVRGVPWKRIVQRFQVNHRVIARLVEQEAS